MKNVQKEQHQVVINALNVVKDARAAYKTTKTIAQDALIHSFRIKTAATLNVQKAQFKRAKHALIVQKDAQDAKNQTQIFVKAAYQGTSKLAQNANHHVEMVKQNVLMTQANVKTAELAAKYAIQMM